MALLAFSAYGGSGHGLSADASMNTVVDQVGDTFNITGGSARGANLFHSFSDFNVETGQTADFRGASSIVNIISRVSGSHNSWIDGTLKSSIPGADLFFLNPNGVMFGPNASLNLSGYFHVTTADFLKLSDGGVLYAAMGEGSSLTSAPVSAFGFSGNDVGPISINGSSLKLPAGKDISLIGGRLEIERTGSRISPYPPDSGSVPPYDGRLDPFVEILAKTNGLLSGHTQSFNRASTLTAPGGRIDLVSVASEGEARLTDMGVNVDNERLGDIKISGGSTISVNNDTIVAVPAAVGRIFVRASAFELDGSHLYAENDSAANAAGVGIGIKADHIHVTGDSRISTRAVAGGKGAGIDLHADETVRFSGRYYYRQTSEIHVTSASTAAGDAGMLAINAKNIEFTDGAWINASAYGAGRGGSVTLSASESVRFSGKRIDGRGSLIQAASAAGATGDAGGLEINAKNIEFTAGAYINSDTQGSGAGGSVTLSASESLRFDGEGGLIQMTTDSTATGAGAALLSFYAVLDEIPESGQGMGGETKQTLFSARENAAGQALKIAGNLKNDRLLSLSYGFLGQLREEESEILARKESAQKPEKKSDKRKEAANFTGKAIFFARRAHSPDILYRWQWQMGRLFTSGKNIEKAIFYYRKSIDTLNPIQRELFNGYRNKKDFFNTRVKPVYLGLAKLFLDQGKLKAARDVMETLKTSELQNYFQSECAAPPNDSGKNHKTPKGVALLYPIAFKDRLTVLADFPDGIRQKETHAGQKEVRDVVAKLRMGLQNRTVKRFMYEAQKLYDWLIRPFEQEFKRRGIHTLVIAPDGALRLIPFSTLHDGEKFLVERYALGVAPAATLTDFGEIRAPENPEILITGLSEARQGFSALPGVRAELKDIASIMNAKRFYSEKEHNLKNLRDQFRNNAYSIVHMATHGVFGDSPENSFLLLYEDKLNMNALSDLIRMGRFRKKKVQLLTLSACQTAMGDERAALGLAGAAVKAGVKSVVATLWFVDDEATSMAIREFYRQLKKPGFSKARALQNAQKSLIAKKRYQHPAYWGPFLLIGGWM
ncbi:conserved hypothetical protein [Candidatus Desulfarcum epimagneticum]|uniref:Filamentous haemagglutinin FhaB/tRNA nuclease CdiA-like TPS domain-containing protein n=1 Tax=uncultured Desulfobacteraceae bacterium TaxID=218296 RepID=A0A484HK60_9BACT|nr:conserved hypothetical protein [uncultured Desulfobacteraceae bacterium]